LSTRKSSPFEMNPSRSMSYTLNATGRAARQPARLPAHPCAHAQRSFSSRPPRLLNALSPPTNSWKSTVPPPLRPRVSATAASARRAHALLVEDRDHPRRERVRRDLRDLQELLAVDRARAVPARRQRRSPSAAWRRTHASSFMKRFLSRSSSPFVTGARRDGQRVRASYKATHSSSASPCRP
jgi:hypothetical protein